MPLTSRLCDNKRNHGIINWNLAGDGFEIYSIDGFEKSFIKNFGVRTASELFIQLQVGAFESN